MSTTIDQAGTGVTPGTVTGWETLAACVHAYQMEPGGARLHTAMLAMLLTDLYGLPANEARNLAEHDTFDPRVRGAAAYMDQLVEKAGREAQAAEYGQVPA